MGSEGHDVRGGHRYGKAQGGQARVLVDAIKVVVYTHIDWVPRYLPQIKGSLSLTIDKYLPLPLTLGWWSRSNRYIIGTSEETADGHHPRDNYIGNDHRGLV